jgi:hypothetical protein
MKAKFNHTIRAAFHPFKPIILVSLCLIFTFAQSGRSASINILEAQYTTAVYDSYTPTMREQTSPSPLIDSIYVSPDPNPEAYANAGLFGVSGSTETDYYPLYGESYGGSSAYEESDLWFQPIASQMACINVQYNVDMAVYTAGNFSLTDITTGNVLWNYGWDFYDAWGVYGAPTGINDGTTIPANYASSGSITNETDLNATDTYELIMRTASDSNDDSESVSIQLTGLEPVPEPNTLTLAGLGGLAAMAVVRRQRK